MSEWPVFSAEGHSPAAPNHTEYMVSIKTKYAIAGLCAALHSGEAFVNSGAKAHQSKCGGSGETLDPCPACSL